MIETIILILALALAGVGSAVFVYGAYGLFEEMREEGVIGPATKPESPVPTRTYPSMSAKVYANLQTNAPDPLMNRISKSIEGDVTEDQKDLTTYSRDTSIFMRMPRMVIFPKTAADVATVVRIAALAKSHGEDISVTARSAGTDMSGGPLTTSLLTVFPKYMNKVLEIGDGYAVTEPGVYYRDFEKQTLAKGNQILPSYPASRELAAMGGIVNNNSGGERSLEYGKTEDYVLEVDVVLSDGTRTTFKELTPVELTEKKKLSTLEGSIYRNMDQLLTEHGAEISAAKPKVSKNSAGYALWNIKNEKTGGFNLAKVITGAQGTLALTTKMKLRLVKDQGFRSMLIIFLPANDTLPEIVSTILPFNPESFESFDEHTLSLAIRFLPQLLMQMGIARATRLGFSFLPEVGMVLTGGVPQLILMAEFSEDTHEEALKKVTGAQAALAHLGVQTRINKDERASEKYWIVRRESFALLRKNSHGLYAAPFIDDFVVPPSSYLEFLPKLHTLLEEYKGKFIYTVAGHIGNGNFHIIPLMDLSKPEVRAVILELAPRVYNLVLSYGGTTTGEHNDGIIRTPYIRQEFGDAMYALFEKIKHIFDPHTIFNPGKKIGGTFEDIKRDMITTW
jgi:FAD/FMN-containing dehydrogenase